jgi:hypothetical protein
MSEPDPMRALLDRALAALEDPDANGADRCELADLLRAEADRAWEETERQYRTALAELAGMLGMRPAVADES